MRRISARGPALALLMLGWLPLACGRGKNATGTAGAGGTTGSAGAGSGGRAGAGGGTAGASTGGATGGTGTSGGAGAGGTTGSAGAGSGGSAGAGRGGGAGGAAGGTTGTGGSAAAWPGTRLLGTTTYDALAGMALDASGNIFLSGETGGALYGQTPNGMNDLFTLKLDGAGTVQWARQIGIGEEWGGGVAVDRTGNVYASGATYTSIDGNPGPGGFDAVLVKYDSAGNRLWTRQYGSAGYDYGGAAATDAAGNVYVVVQAGGAFAGNTSAGNSDVALVKFDGAGTQQWARQFGTTEYDYAGRVATDGAGNIYVTFDTIGTFEGNVSPMGDGYLLKFDGTGARLWTRPIGTTTGESAAGVTVDATGAVYVVGLTIGDIGGSGNAGTYDFYVAKYDGAGTALWVRQHGTSGGDSGSGVATDAAGDVYVVGSTQGFDPMLGSGQSAPFLAKYDGSGTFLWWRQVPNTFSSSANSVAVDSRGDIYMAGNCLNTFEGQFMGGGDFFVMKYSAAGVKLP